MALLLAATATGMVVTQHLRDEGAVVSSIRLKTRPGARYRACFRLTRDDRVQVAMVDYDDRVVRVLSPARALEGSDTPHCFDWDGRNDAGQPVPPGRYHLRVELEDADRVAISGERLKVTAEGASTP